MNMQYDLKAFAKKVKKHQEKERYEHTKGRNRARTRWFRLRAGRWRLSPHSR